MPLVSWQKFGELRVYAGFKNYTGDYNQLLHTHHQIELRRHYFAAISWVDSLIGRLLKVLSSDDEVRKSTVVAFLGSFISMTMSNSLLSWLKQCSSALTTTRSVILEDLKES